MIYSSEQHFAVAKLIRRNAANGVEASPARAVRVSNTFLVCARLAPEYRGGISLAGFQWSCVTPDWTVIEKRIDRLATSLATAGPQLFGPNGGRACIERPPIKPSRPSSGPHR
jgi:hypothetical protein